MCNFREFCYAKNTLPQKPSLTSVLWLRQSAFITPSFHFDSFISLHIVNGGGIKIHFKVFFGSLQCSFFLFFLFLYFSILVPQLIYYLYTGW